MVQTVIDVVVKHTGYPADFVELDQDLKVSWALIRSNKRDHGRYSSAIQSPRG